MVVVWWCGGVVVCCPSSQTVAREVDVCGAFMDRHPEQDTQSSHPSTPEPATASRAHRADRHMTVMHTHKSATPDPVNINTTTCCTSTLNTGGTGCAWVCYGQTCEHRTCD